MSSYTPKPSLSSSVIYRDAKAALRWLEEAFGFEPSMVILDENDEVAHSEMRFGEGLIMVGREWPEGHPWAGAHKSPASLGGGVTQSVHIQLAAADGGLDAHCERARKAGAIILMEPADQFYGDRTYRAADPEGHIWTIAQTVRVTGPAEWDKAMGLTTKTRL